MKAKIHTGRGIVELELYPNIAPNTVSNFVSLAKSGFYDGLVFHRVISGFMIQGGCPDGNGMGNPGYAIKGEFAQNGFDNNIAHEKGVISMARSGDPDSAGSQFFIMHENAPHLDGSYAAFGKVVSGQEHVDAIATCKTDHSDRPIAPETIERIEIDTQGVDCPEPVKVPRD